MVFKYNKLVKLTNLAGSATSPDGSNVSNPFNFVTQYSDPIKIPKDCFVSLYRLTYTRNTTALVVADSHCIVEIPELGLQNSMVAYHNNGLVTAGSQIGGFQFAKAGTANTPVTKLSRTNEYFYPLRNIKDGQISKLTCRLLNSRGFNRCPESLAAGVKKSYIDEDEEFEVTIVLSSDNPFP